MPAVTSLWGPLSNRRFRAMWSADLISWIGSGATMTALLVYIALRYGSGGTAAYMLTAAIATLGIATAAGVTADRADRRTITIAADLLRAALSIALALTLTRGLAWILALTAARTAIGAFASSANAAGLASILNDPDTDTVRGYTLASVGSNFSRVAGLGAGGLLSAGHHYSSAFILDAASFAAAAALRYRIGQLRPQPGTNTADSPPPSFLADVRAGIRHLTRAQGLRSAVGLVALSTVAGQCVNVLFVLLVVTTLHAAPWWIAVTELSGVLVMLAAAPRTARIIDRIGAPRALRAGVALTAVSVAALGLIPHVAYAIPLDLTWGLGASLVSTALPVIINDVTPDHLRGRTEANIGTVMQAIGLLAIPLVGGLSTALGTRTTFIACALPVLAAAVAVRPSQLRASRTGLPRDA